MSLSCSLELNEENNQLVDVIKVRAEKKIRLGLFFKKVLKRFRHSIIEIEAEENSDVKIYISHFGGV